MFEALKNRYPGRFTIPTESEVRIEIQRLFQEQKKLTTGGVITAKGWKQYTNKIPGMLNEYKILDTKTAFAKFNELHDEEQKNSDDFPTPKQIKDKITREITKLKQEQNTSTLGL